MGLNSYNWIATTYTYTAIDCYLFSSPQLIRHADMLPSETQREIYYRKSPAKDIYRVIIMDFGLEGVALVMN